MNLRSLRYAALGALALALGLATAPAAAATTRTVCTTGCDHSTIAAAVTASSAGDTVLVKEDQLVGASIAIGKDLTITGADGVTITRTGTSSNVFAIGPTGDGTTISNLTLTTATVVRGAFITINGADGVTLDGNTIFAPAQPGPMSTWVVNRAWTNNNVTGLTVTGNTIHSLRTGGYIDNGTGTISGNVTWNTKGDYLLDEQADFAFTGNSAGDPSLPSEWGIVIFGVNERPYDVQALGAANDCLSVWDQGTDETFVDGDCDGIDDTPPPTHKDDCKQGGWATFNNPSFKNQGQCVSSVVAGKS